MWTMSPTSCQEPVAEPLGMLPHDEQDMSSVPGRRDASPRTARTAEDGDGDGDDQNHGSNGYQRYSP